MNATGHQVAAMGIAASNVAIVVSTILDVRQICPRAIFADALQATVAHEPTNDAEKLAQAIVIDLANAIRNPVDPKPNLRLILGGPPE